MNNSFQSSLCHLSKNHRLRKAWKDANKFNGDDVSILIEDIDRIIFFVIQPDTVIESLNKQVEQIDESGKQLLRKHFQLEIGMNNGKLLLFNIF
ncbi:MAG: hypothetical protein WD512_05310 [Candidatus Paceibacterota bacterium]